MSYDGVTSGCLDQLRGRGLAGSDDPVELFPGSLFGYPPWIVRPKLGEAGFKL